MKKKNLNKKIIEIVSLVIAILSLTIGFLAFSSHFKIQSQVTAHRDKLNFNVVFSSKDYKEENAPITPILSSGKMHAEKAVIINAESPIISNLIVNFTNPGQVAKYNFYIYNSGEYMAYLNSIYYDKIGRTNLSKICIPKSGRSNETVNKVCEHIKISIKVGDLSTSETLYHISDRPLRPRTAQPVEVVIEYLDEDVIADESFDVIFGDISLYYSLFPSGANSAEM